MSARLSRQALMVSVLCRRATFGNLPLVTDIEPREIALLVSSIPKFTDPYEFNVSNSHFRVNFQAKEVVRNQAG